MKLAMVGLVPQGDGGGGLPLALALVAVATIVGLGLLARRLLRRHAVRSPAKIALGTLVGVAVGAYLVFFVFLGDLGKTYLAERAAPTIEVHVPREVKGGVYLFFDPALPPLVPDRPGHYVIALPPDGQARYGPIDQMERVFDFAVLQLRYPDGAAPPEGFLPSRQGSFGGVRYRRFFIGTDAEAQADVEQRTATGRSNDEVDVYKALAGAVRAP